MKSDVASARPVAGEYETLLQSEATSQAPAASLSRGRRVMLYGVMLLPILVLCVAHWGNLPGIGMTDYAQYLMQADAFLRGEGIMSSRYIFTPLNPAFGPAAYPPGLPATLVPVMAIFGDSPAAYKVVMIVSLAAFAVIVALYFERRTGLGVALMIGLFSGLALESAHATQVVLSDVGFCALFWATILAIDADDWSWKRVITVTALGFAAISYRSAGVVLIPALLLFALINRRRLGARPAIPAVLWLVTILAAVVALNMTGAAAALHVPHPSSVVGRLWAYRWSLLQSHLYPFPSDRLNDGYHLLTVALMFVGLVTWLARDRLRSFLSIVALGYFAMLLVAWVASDRYLWPLYPVAIFGLMYAALLMLRRMRSAWTQAQRSRPIIVAGSAVAVLAIVTSARAVPPPSLLDQPEVQELFDHIRSLESTGSPRIAFSNARVLAWETGVHAMPLIDASAEESVAEFRRLGITHVIHGDGGLDSWDNKILGETVRQRPQDFVLEFQNEGFALYRFLGGS